jgi:hypothetical protein
MALPVTIMAEAHIVVITAERRRLSCASMAEKRTKMPFREGIGAMNLSVAR